MRFGLLLVASYLIGAIPFALLIARAWSGIDIRQHGSGNVGATNVLRVVGKKAGILCLALDFLKGFLPTLAAIHLLTEPTPLPLPVQWALVGIASVIGHCLPIYLMSLGGKGVATSLGVFMALMPLPTGIIAAIAVTIMATTGYVAIGSCVGAILLPVLNLFMGSHWYLWITVPLALFINLRHLGNWRRLLSGTEPKIWDKAKLGKDEGVRRQSEAG